MSQFFLLLSTDMSYDTCTTYSAIPVAMPPNELEEKITAMLAPEIESLVTSWNPDGANHTENLSEFSASFLNGALCFLEDDAPDEGTRDQIVETISNFYQITAGDSPDSSVIKLWAWSEDDYTSHTQHVDHLESFFLPLLDGDYFLGGWTNENSRCGGEGGSYVVLKNGTVIPFARLVDSYFARKEES